MPEIQLPDDASTIDPADPPDLLTAERAILKAMIDQVPDYLFVKDLQSRFLIVNRAVTEIHGAHKPVDIIGKTDFDLHPPEKAMEFFEIEQALMKSGQPRLDMEEAVHDPRGKIRHLSTSKVPMRDQAGAIIGLVGISRDVTERKRAERIQEVEASILEMIATNSPLADVLTCVVSLIEEQLPGTIASVMLLDEDGRRLRKAVAPRLPVEYANATDGIPIGPVAGSCGAAAFWRAPFITDDIESDLLWAGHRELALQHDLRSCWSIPILSPENLALGTFAIYSPQPNRFDASMEPITGIATKLSSIAIEQKRSADRIQFLARHDPLTGLLNRGALESRIAEMIASSEPGTRTISVVFIDLDHFKFINDSMGHSTGDKLLKIVADRMVRCLRDSDSLVRFGGDEFVAALGTPWQSRTSIAAAARKLQGTISQSVMLEGRPISVSSSMGIATHPQDGSDVQTLVANADAAMYRAKDLGRNRVAFHSEWNSLDDRRTADAEDPGRMART